MLLGFLKSGDFDLMPNISYLYWCLILNFYFRLVSCDGGILKGVIP